MSHRYTRLDFWSKSVYRWKMIYSAVTSTEMKALNQNLANIKKLTPFKTSRNMSRDYFSKSRKLSTNWCQFKERNQATTFFSFILNISNTPRLEWLSIENIMGENMILNAQI